jgi:uncharacterized protein YceK
MATAMLSVALLLIAAGCSSLRSSVSGKPGSQMATREEQQQQLSVHHKGI